MGITYIPYTPSEVGFVPALIILLFSLICLSFRDQTLLFRRCLFLLQVLRKSMFDPRLLLHGSSNASGSVYTTAWISRQYWRCSSDPIFPAIHGFASLLLPVSVCVLNPALSVRYQDAWKRGSDLHKTEAGKSGYPSVASHCRSALYGWNAGLQNCVYRVYRHF